MLEVKGCEGLHQISRAHVVPGIAQRLDRTGEEQRLAHRRRLGPEALLRGLGPEGGEVRRQDDAGDDLDALVLELGDMGRKIVRQVLITARVDQGVAGAGERLGEAELGVAPGVAVAVVGEEAADHLVGLQLAPEVEEHADHVLQPPEIVVGPLEARRRIAAAAEEVGLPRAERRDAGDLVDLGLVGDRVGGLRRVAGAEQVHLVGEDQLARDLGRAVRVRLAVLDDDLDIEAIAAGLDLAADRLQHRGDVELVGIRERCERAGLGADIADPHRVRSADDGGEACTERGRSYGAGGADFQDFPTGRPGAFRPVALMCHRPASSRVDRNWRLLI